MGHTLFFCIWELRGNMVLLPQIEIGSGILYDVLN